MNRRIAFPSQITLLVQYPRTNTVQIPFYDPLAAEDDEAESKAASWSTKSSMTDLGGCGEVAGTAAMTDDRLVGTSRCPSGSKPGAMRRSASRFRRSFSSARERRYSSRRVVCAASVERRDDSSVRT